MLQHDEYSTLDYFLSFFYIVWNPSFFIHDTTSNCEIISYDGDAAPHESLSCKQR